MAEATANNTNSGTESQATSTAIFPPKGDGASNERDIAVTKTENTVHEPEHPGVKPSQPPQEQRPENASRPENEGTKVDPPQEMKLELPKDSPIPAGLVERIADYAKSHGLSQEQAQSLVNREHQARVDYQKMVSGWKQQVLDDPEVGGPNAAKNVELAKRVWRRFADQEMIREAEESGLADHPGLVKFMVRVGKLMAEDQFVNSTTTNATPKDPVEIFYGKTS